MTHEVFASLEATGAGLGFLISSLYFTRLPIIQLLLLLGVAICSGITIYELCLMAG